MLSLLVLVLWVSLANQVGAAPIMTFEVLGGDSSEAYEVSADGSVVVGQTLDAARNFFAYRWTAAEGMVRIANGSAVGASADGSVVTGWRPMPTGGEAFRWTPERMEPFRSRA